MKRILFFFALTIMYRFAIAQAEVGANFFGGTTWLLNNNVSDQGQNLDYRSAFGFSGGINAAYYFSPVAGAGLEVNYATVTQKYDGDPDTASHFTAADHLKYVTIPILFKLKTAGGFYFEIGPQISLLSGASGELAWTPDPASLISYSDRDIKIGFNNVVFGGLFGFGGRFNVSDNMAITAGLRLYGSLADVTEELSAIDFIADALAEKLGVAATFAHTDQSGNFVYQKTTAATGGLQIGFVYTFNE